MCIIAAIGVGIGLARAIPGLAEVLEIVTVGSVSPPALMFALAWLLLPDLPACLPTAPG